MKPHELKEFLYEKIPLANALGIEIPRSDDNGTEIFAPLAPNKNHLETAFGGSLSAVLIISCYGWLFHQLVQEGLDIHVVIKSGQTDYLLPVSEDFTATCLAPDPEIFKKFLEHFERKGKARLSLEAFIENKEGKACLFRGVFVAVKA